MISIRSKTTLLWMIAAVGIGALIAVGPIAQDPDYHLFADSRSFAGITNFWNVISNVPFIAVGLYGFSRSTRLTQSECRMGYLLLCAAVTMVAFGSAYYHHAPSNETLLWDRLPMTVAFTALFGMLLGERVLTAFKQEVLWSLVMFGICAAFYWAWTETKGHGDLRPYVLVQFLPIVLMPVILLLFPARYLRTNYLLYAFALYFVAKALEHFDRRVEQLLDGFSGHPIKHLVAAVAVLCVILSVPASETSSAAPPSR
jgi:Ceramidase